MEVEMSAHASRLVVGELIQIKYRVARPSAMRDAELEFADRWVTAQIIRRDGDSLPLARLSDGQLTDIRAYMTWRSLSRPGTASPPGSSH